MKRSPRWPPGAADASPRGPRWRSRLAPRSPTAVLTTPSPGRPRSRASTGARWSLRQLAESPGVLRIAEAGDRDVHGVCQAGEELVVGDAGGAPVVGAGLSRPAPELHDAPGAEVTAAASDEEEGDAADVVGCSF